MTSSNDGSFQIYKRRQVAIGNCSFPLPNPALLYCHKQHPVFVHAKIRIWVTTLDPAQPPIPERTRVVVNRVPSHLPFDPREVVKADIALMVPDGGLDALLSLYTHVAWITKQGREVQEAWRALVKAKEPEANQRTVDELGADDTW